ncbi:MAG: AI-2E family transporter [Ruminococcaceae bacterium]|nr:AI-2E family transporter [Oscillospiraceae bacterium]
MLGGTEMSPKRPKINMTLFRTNIAVLLIGLVLFWIITNFDQIGKLLYILTPFFIGFVIAYILSSPVSFFESTILRFIDRKKPHPRIKRVISILLSFILFFGLVTALLSVVIPQLIKSVETLISNFSGYLAKIDQLFTSLSVQYDLDLTFLMEIFDEWEVMLLDKNSIVNTILNTVLTYLTNIVSAASNVASSIGTAFVSFIISIYFLGSKEKYISQFKKILYAFMNRRFAEKVFDIAAFTDRTFNRYFYGQLIDSAIVGIVCFIFMSIFKFPYALLISVLIGVTNIIPFFGPFIGAIPSIFILLIVNPAQAFWFTLFILILQQVEGNIVAPRILGNTIGLPSIWIMVGIIVGGGLFGIVGMVLGVPTVAVLHEIFSQLVEYRLKRKNMSTDTSDYSGSISNHVPYHADEDKEDDAE